VHQVSVRGGAHGGGGQDLPQALLQVQGLQEQPQIEQLRAGGWYFVLQDLLREGYPRQERTNIHVSHDVTVEPGLACVAGACNNRGSQGAISID